MMKEYTKTHEWIEKQDGIATIGISKDAAKEVGEIVYVELPEVGKAIEKGKDSCVIESTKAAIDIEAPISGTICEVNEALKSNIALLNDCPEAEGWLYRVRYE